MQRVLRPFAASLAIAMLGSCGGGDGGGPPPTLSFDVWFGDVEYPTSIMFGQSVTVSWSTAGATTCVASGAWSGTEAPNGSANITPGRTGSNLYTLSCSGPGGTAAQSYVLQVDPFVSRTISPQAVLAGQSATLSWSSSGAATCAASGAWAGTQALSGQVDVSPVFPGTYYYDLSCADSMGDTTVVTTPYLLVSPNGYSNTRLVANNSGPARNSDPSLLDPWGIAFPPNHAVVVASNQGNTSTSYDGTGAAQSPGVSQGPLAVQLPAGAGGAPFNPTGVVAAPAGVMVTAAGKSRAAQLIYAGESGMIAAWAPTVDPTNAVVVYADSGGAVYKSLAIAANYLYAADFHNNKVDVFDLTFTKQSGYPFIDPALPAGYAPHGLLYVGGNRIWVAYAMQLAPANRDAMAGPGLGIVDMFDLQGTFSKRFITGGALNAPWGMDDGCNSPWIYCGGFGGRLLVANTGDGTINGFDGVTGAPLGTLTDASGTPLTISGLHGIALGNRHANQPDFTLIPRVRTTRGLSGALTSAQHPGFTHPPRPFSHNGWTRL